MSGKDERSFVLEKRPEASYRALLDSGELERRARRALEGLRECAYCPRACRADRSRGAPDQSAAGARSASSDSGANGTRTSNEAKASCKTGRYASISSVGPHFGEERCLRGLGGSGTIFFTSCNLRCVFCQNWDISHVGGGEETTAAELSDMMLALAEQGCHNINLVTPSHVVPQLLEALLIAAEAGLDLPIVYNSSGYDSPEALALLDGVVDIYMPDLKCWDEERARRHLKAADYPEVARRAVREMHRQVGDLVLTRAGVAARGLLVRHLVMPGGGEETRAILRFLADEVSADTYVNVMDQYYPSGDVDPARYPELCRRPDPSELHAAHGHAAEAGLWRLDGRRLPW